MWMLSSTRLPAPGGWSTVCLHGRCHLDRRPCACARFCFSQLKRTQLPQRVMESRPQLPHWVFETNLSHISGDPNYHIESWKRVSLDFKKPDPLEGIHQCTYIYIYICICIYIYVWTCFVYLTCYMLVSSTGLYFMCWFQEMISMSYIVFNLCLLCHMLVSSGHWYFKCWFQLVLCGHVL